MKIRPRIMPCVGVKSHAATYLLALTLVITSALPATGTTLEPVSEAGLRDDAPKDGIADSIGDTLWVYNTTSATTVAVMEYAVSSFAGEEVKVRLRSPLQGRRNFTGLIVACDDGVVTLSVDGQRVDLPFEQIGTARLVPRS